MTWVPTGLRVRRTSSARVGAVALFAAGLQGALVIAACGAATEPPAGLSTDAAATLGARAGEGGDARQDAPHDAHDAYLDAGLDAGHVTDASDASDATLADAADAGPRPQAPCQRPTADLGVRSDACLARLALAGRDLPYYRSHGLESTDAAVENLVLIQHGNSRNAWDYYDTVAAAATLRDSGRTAVLAPLFQASNSTCGFDAKAPNDLYWGCSDWKEGGVSRNATIDSYAALDALLAAAKVAFPRLRRVTIAGYSAGGQTIQRYLAGNTEHDRTPGITTRYVVASPGSYMYLDGRRVRPDAVCTSASNCALTAASFVLPPYAGSACQTDEPAVEPGGDAYDDYRYGLANRTGYLAAIPDATLRANTVARPVVYVLSEGDAAAAGARPVAYGALDKSCAAMAQAPLGASYRLQRGLVYHQYVTSLFGAAHRRRIVPVCGHEEGCVLTDPGTRDELFGP